MVRTLDFGLLVALAGCHDGDAKGPYHCGNTSMVCVEFPDATSASEVSSFCEEVCASVKSGPCSHDGTIGECVVPDENFGEIDWWGSPAMYTAAQFQDFCDGKHGTVTPSS